MVLVEPWLQETVPFSGTVYGNLLAANPNADFNAVVQAAKIAGVHGVRLREQGVAVHKR